MAKAPPVGQPVPWDADEGRQQSAEDRDQELKKAQLATQRAIRLLMLDESGREWLREIISQCGVFQTILPNEQLDMAYRLGMRNIGLRIYGDLEHNAPDLIPLLTRSKPVE